MECTISVKRAYSKDETGATLMGEPAYHAKLNDWETWLSYFDLGDYDEFEANISDSEDEDDSQVFF